MKSVRRTQPEVYQCEKITNIRFEDWEGLYLEFVCVTKMTNIRFENWEGLYLDQKNSNYSHSVQSARSLFDNFFLKYTGIWEISHPVNMHQAVVPFTLKLFLRPEVHLMWDLICEKRIQNEGREKRKEKAEKETKRKVSVPPSKCKYMWKEDTKWRKKEKRKTKKEEKKEKETRRKVSVPADKCRPTGSTWSFAAAIISRNSSILLSLPHSDSYFLSDFYLNIWKAVRSCMFVRYTLFNHHCTPGSHQASLALDLIRAQHPTRTWVDATRGRRFSSLLKTVQ